jgi:hypothetical protein
MKPQKVRFTVWLDPATLEVAKVRSRQDGVSVSEALAEAATESLLRNRADAETQIVKAIERVFYLVQRTDRKRSFDEQVLKEMVGLMVLSFFNHTPAVPEANKKAALMDGKARFHRFLDTLAANLRGGNTILSDLPGPVEEAERTVSGNEVGPVGKPEPPQASRAASNGAQSKQPSPTGVAYPDPPAPPKAHANTEAVKPVEESASTGVPPDPTSSDSKPSPAGADAAATKKRWGLFG